VREGGRLQAARRAVIDGVARSEFLDVVAPQGALYAFPSVRTENLGQFDDEDFALELLQSESVLIVPGTGFNIRERNHFRLTLLPQPAEIDDVFVRIDRCLGRIAERSAPAPARHVA